MTNLYGRSLGQALALTAGLVVSIGLSALRAVVNAAR